MVSAGDQIQRELLVNECWEVAGYTLPTRIKSGRRVKKDFRFRQFLIKIKNIKFINN